MELDITVKIYLEEVNAHEVNPVWNNWSKEYIIGYQYEVLSRDKLMEVRKDLEDLFNMDGLNYSLSEEAEHQRQYRFIIYLNNDKRH